MWNPIHFAVYNGNLNLLKFFIEEEKVNVGTALIKPIPESERDENNSNKFDEDKIHLLLIAYEKKDSQILSYLLESAVAFWPLSTIEWIL